LAERLARLTRETALWFLESRPRLIALLIIVVVLAMAALYPSTFPTMPNAKAVLLNTTRNSIMVCGMMMLLAAGAFDLSVGSVLSLAGIVAGTLSIGLGVPGPIAALCALATGAGAGLINGLLVTRLRINPLIVTLGTMSAFLGLTQLISGSGIDRLPASLTVFGQTVLFGFQLPFWIAITVVLVSWFLMSQTAYFRQLYFIGGNAKAAKLSGIRNARVLTVAFMIMGTLAALAGVLDAARLSGADSTAGAGSELQIVTAAVLGGASLEGGEGTVLGGVLGVLFIALVQNSLLHLGVGVFWQNIVTGVVLIIAVGLDSVTHRESA
jgi:ribose transport system permease protein